MKTMAIGLILAALFASNPGVSSGAEAPQPTLKVGFAEADITPDMGMEVPGGYGKVFGRSVHDPCKVRAAVLDDGVRRVALVGVDALIIRRPMVVAARKGIQERCGITPDSVLI